jgi:hypothetical protein
MLARKAVFGLLLMAAGCQTHLALQDNSVRATGTLTDLNYQQVLNNVAMFVANPSALPSVAVFNAGTVTASDQQTINASATYSPTLTFAQQGGGALPILSLLANPGAQRNITENWSLVPVTDIDNLRRIRCAFQLLVLDGGQTADCESCWELLRRFYLGETDRMDCVIPRGWFHAGCKKDVPGDACFVGEYHGTYVWVMPDGREGLTRFTMTVIDLATGKPHAPMKTVVRTLKADGSLDNTQITTSEIDWDALDKMKAHSERPERQRQNVTPPVVNPGLFFVPR